MEEVWWPISMVEIEHLMKKWVALHASKLVAHRIDELPSGQRALPASHSPTVEIGRESNHCLHHQPTNCSTTSKMKARSLYPSMQHWDHRDRNSGHLGFACPFSDSWI